ncbi:MAG: 50S ribosomal protein L25/general stress protein Ctc [Gammaproteobacteria bacterium]|nr:50S ribosomal protein L25/general stress protein Ctc [Gammaproteobacteria bacterium]
MKQTFTINATLRGDQGKGASRRLRHADKVPGIVYGAGTEPAMIIIEHNALLKLLVHDSFYTKILDLDIDGKKEQVILRDLQRHPFKPRILHLDLQRISDAETIAMRVPLRFSGEANSPGVKLSGALISHLMSNIEVRCLPKYLPEVVEVDLSQIVLNQTIHLSDLKLPKEVEIVALAHGEDKPIATAYIPRVAVEDTAAPVAAEVPVAGKPAAEEGAADKEGAEDKGKK